MQKKKTYAVFGLGRYGMAVAEELAPSIRSIHGNAKHMGRAPAKAKAKNKKENGLIKKYKNVPVTSAPPTIAYE